MKRHPGKSIQAVLVTAVLLALSASVPASAGVWKTGADDPESWWYDHQDGTWAVGWELIDGNGDGIGEWYLFDEDGWLITDYMTKDGYEVDQNGAWVQSSVDKKGTQTLRYLEYRNEGSGRWICRDEEDGTFTRLVWHRDSGTVEVSDADLTRHYIRSE